MNNVTRVRIVYECSIIGVVLLTFLKGMFPYMGAWWRVALITSLVGLWFSLSYLKRYNYKWGFNYIGNHLYINLLLSTEVVSERYNHSLIDTCILKRPLV